MNEKSRKVLSFLKENYPDAKCALNFRNDYECLFAIALSAQTTDKAVNSVTPALFERFPTVDSLSIAEPKDVYPYISKLGLASTKAKNLVMASRAIVNSFSSQIPAIFSDLTSLPGIGKKTAAVYLLERKGVPAIPIDTHVGRLAVRLGYAKEGDSVDTIKKNLERNFDKPDWHFVHLALIAFGRDRCKAVSPSCDGCALRDVCRYKGNKSSSRGRKS